MDELLTNLEILKSKLTEMGHADWAKKLEVAEAGGSTGTEIIVRIGECLQNLKKSDVKLTPEMKTLCKSVSKEISKRFKSI